MCKLGWLCAKASILTVFVLDVTSSAHAQVYRCERGGNIEFSDQPCVVGAKESKKDYATSASGVLDLQLTVPHYDVLGKDYESVVRSMNNNGLRGAAGLAAWKVRYTYTTKKSRDDCQIATVRVIVSGEILMPRWTGESDAPRELQRWWSNMYDKLKRHEDGHIQHGRELALLVKERLMGLGVVPCDQLQSLAQREYQSIYDNLKGRDQEYDRRTNHGLNQ